MYSQPNQRKGVPSSPPLSDWEDVDNCETAESPPRTPPHPRHLDDHAYFPLPTGSESSSYPPPNLNHSRFPGGGVNLSSLPLQRGGVIQESTRRHNNNYHHSSRVTAPPLFHQMADGEGEEEPEDVVVWNTGQGQGPGSSLTFHQSLSDDGSRQSLRKSRSIRSLGSVAHKTTEDESSILQISSSNGNFLSEEYENHMAAVTKQLEQIKTTQDSILSELSEDMSNLQFDNVQLKNTNEHLTMQNSHLLQVITDLSNEVEGMRAVFRVRGWPLKEVVGPEVAKDEKAVVPSPPAPNDGKVPEPEMKPKSSSDPEKRRHRSRSRDGSRATKDPKAPTPGVLPEKFETIPLSDDPRQGKRKEESRSPGEEQVEALSMSPNVGGGLRSGRKRRTKAKLAAMSSDSMRDGVGSNCSSNYKQNLTRKMTSDRIVSSGEKGGSSGGCFKGLFKRRNKKKRSRPSSSDQFVRQ